MFMGLLATFYKNSLAITTNLKRTDDCQMHINVTDIWKNAKLPFEDEARLYTI
jgi:hypothetical protein